MSNRIRDGNALNIFKRPEDPGILRARQELFITNKVISLDSDIAQVCDQLLKDCKVDYFDLPIGMQAGLWASVIKMIYTYIHTCIYTYIHT